MTVTTTLDRQYFPGDGSNKNFPFNFKFFDNSQIFVYLIDASGTATGKILNVDYTLSGALSPVGGMVVMAVAPPVGYQVLVRRILSVTQPTSIRNQGAFFPAIHEDVFDRLTMICQQAVAAANLSLQKDLSGLYWDFNGYQAINLGDPSRPQDATNKRWVETYIGGLLETGQGPANTAANVLYVGPDGVTHTVQDMSSDIGASLLSYKGSDTGSVKQSIQKMLDMRNAYPFQFKLPSDPDDTNSWVKALATGKLVDGLGLNYTISSTIEVPSDRMVIRANFTQAGGSVDNKSMLQMTGLSGTIKQNIYFIDVHLNGNREAQTNIGFGESGDGERHGFYVKGQARNILFSRCSADNCATDGLTLFGAAAGVTFAIQGVVIDQCSFRKNRRHGVAFDTLFKLRAYGGDWTGNGTDLPGAAGHPINSGYYGARVGNASGPQYGNGCDIESYGADDTHSTHVEDVEFHGVNMTGNYSGGLKILTMPGEDYNGTPGYNHPNWKPMKHITVFGGTYDDGVNGTPSAETSPIQVGAALLLPLGVYGVFDFNVYGASCNSSIAINNTKFSNIQTRIEHVNFGTFAYHAFVANSDGINLNLSTVGELKLYQENSTVTKNINLTSSTAPTVSISGGTLSSQQTTLVSSSIQSGQLYRINISANMTLAVGSNLQFNILGGRTILEVQGAYFNASTSEVKAAFYRASGGFVLFKPDTQNPLEIVLYVTVA